MDWCCIIALFRETLKDSGEGTSLSIDRGSVHLPFIDEEREITWGKKERDSQVMVNGLALLVRGQ
jgi:hypothetical protein